jgi:hypothetical protein
MIKLLDNTGAHIDMSNINVKVENFYCILDWSNQNDVDFKFNLLDMLVQESWPVGVLKIGDAVIQLPLNWKIAVADRNCEYIEMIEITELRKRPFCAFGFDPLRGFYPEFLPIELIDRYPNMDILWPLLKNGHLLSYPIKKNCCIFICPPEVKIPDMLDIGKIFQ